MQINLAKVKSRKMLQINVNLRKEPKFDSLWNNTGYREYIHI